MNLACTVDGAKLLFQACAMSANIGSTLASYDQNKSRFAALRSKTATRLTVFDLPKTLFQQFTGDDNLPHFRCAGANLQKLGRAIEAIDFRFAHITHAAMDLH